MTFDYSVYGILDPARSRGRTLPTLARTATRGGVTLFQYRDKTGATKAMIEQTRALLAVTRRAGVPLLVNDRVDVAFAAGADGVHVGRHDMDPEDARRLLGDEAVIGLTIHTVAEARSAPVELVDYFGVGAVFETASKRSVHAPIRLKGLRHIRDILRERAPELPAVGIGGINAENAGSVIEAGVDGVCVISDIFMAPDVEQAAQRLADAVRDQQGGGTG